VTGTLHEGEHFVIRAIVSPPLHETQAVATVISCRASLDPPLDCLGRRKIDKLAAKCLLVRAPSRSTRAHWALGDTKLPRWQRSAISRLGHDAFGARQNRPLPASDRRNRPPGGQTIKIGARTARRSAEVKVCVLSGVPAAAVSVSRGGPASPISIASSNGPGPTHCTGTAPFSSGMMASA
jgi:hypothetical protein